MRACVRACLFVCLFVSSCNVPLFLPGFSEILTFSTDFLKILKFQISWKSVQWGPSCSMQTDGQTEEQTWRITVQFPYLENLQERKWWEMKEKGCAGYEPSNLFRGTWCKWKIPVPNASAARPSAAGTVALMSLINASAQTVVSESSTLSRRIPSQCYPHSLNTFPVSSYRD